MDNTTTCITCGGTGKVYKDWNPFVPVYMNSHRPKVEERKCSMCKNGRVDKQRYVEADIAQKKHRQGLRDLKDYADNACKRGW